MENPLPTLGFVITYLAWVLVVGPIYMRDRKPFQLRNTLIYYNAGQVLLSAYMFYEHLMAGWAASYDYSCEKVDYSDGSQSRRVRMSYVCVCVCVCLQMPSKCLTYDDDGVDTGHHFFV